MGKIIEKVANKTISQYIKARQIALSNNSARAIYWLQKSIEAGFNYKQVLQNDPAWEKFKTKIQWKDLFKGMSLNVQGAKIGQG